MKKNEASQPAAFNHAVRRLWDSYQRLLAIELIKELAQIYGEKPITQYWLKQVLTVEPQLAKQNLPKEFLDNYYQPEVAAQCGNAG